jgi:hypothetical protein
MAKDKLNQSTIIGVAGDPGGSRALLPVFEHFSKIGVSFEIFDHGYLGMESPSHWKRISFPCRDGGSAEDILAERNVRVLVFGSSLRDGFPLQIARYAKKRKIPVIHVLDHWANYLNRLQTDRRPPLFPDIYTVIDQKAYEQAVAEGIPSTILRIAGQPSFASMLSNDLMNMESPHYQIPYTHSVNKKDILFISEPVSIDQGDSPSMHSYRGYTEEQVLTLLCEHLQQVKSEIRFTILPHPRENVEELGRLFERVKGDLDGKIIERSNGKSYVHQANGIIGMASVLLYEAWLLGKPVISLQPGLRKQELAFMKGREGCLFIDRSKDVKSYLNIWIHNISSNPFKNAIRKDDLRIHQEAAARICEIILSL